MPIAWNPKIWKNFCMTENENKRNKTDFYRVMLLIHQQYSTETFCQTKTRHSSKIFIEILSF